MNGLAMLRKHSALLRIARIKSQHWDAARTDPLENTLRMRAQSLLAGPAYRDGSCNPGTLTLAQAQDVLAWATWGAA